jgi:hypothetical protein
MSIEDTETKPTTENAEPAKQEAAPAPKQDAPPPERRVLTLTPDRVVELQRQAQQELATSLGFASVEELRERASAAEEEVEEEPELEEEHPELDDLFTEEPERERAPTLAERQADRRAERLADELAATRAKAALREAALAVGVKDLDVAMSLMKTHLKTLDDAALEAFDERAYFKGLLTKRPYLAANPDDPSPLVVKEVVEERPAQTGPKGAPPPPRAPNNEAAQPFDAMKASRAEVEARLASLGIGAGGSFAPPIPQHRRA